MPIIGIFSAVKDGYAGAIRTLTMSVRVRLVANDRKEADGAPDSALWRGDRDRRGVAQDPLPGVLLRPTLGLARLRLPALPRGARRRLPGWLARRARLRLSGWLARWATLIEMLTRHEWPDARGLQQPKH